jgi:hypothetical protein
VIRLERRFLLIVVYIRWLPWCDEVLLRLQP